jgi:hypothetical protein
MEATTQILLLPRTKNESRSSGTIRTTARRPRRLVQLSYGRSMGGRCNMPAKCASSARGFALPACAPGGYDSQAVNKRASAFAVTSQPRLVISRWSRKSRSLPTCPGEPAQRVQKSSKSVSGLAWLVGFGFSVSLDTIRNEALPATKRNKGRNAESKAIAATPIQAKRGC